jgi:hypothetical protein
MPGRWSCDPATLGAHQKTLTHQERLGDLFDGFALFTNRDCQRGQSDRTATEPAAHRIEYRVVQSVEAKLVYLIQLQGVLGDR